MILILREGIRERERERERERGHVVMVMIDHQRMLSKQRELKTN